MEGVAVIDNTGKHVWISQEVPALKGKVIGTPVLKLVSSEDRHIAEKALLRAIVERRPWRYTVRAGGAGDIRRYKCRIEPLPSDSAAIVAWSTVDNVPILDDVELQVLELICEDMSSRQMAEHLGMTQYQIEGVHRRIRRKLGTKGIAGEVRWAMRHGLVQ